MVQEPSLSGMTCTMAPLIILPSRRYRKEPSVRTSNSRRLFCSRFDAIMMGIQHHAPSRRISGRVAKACADYVVMHGGEPSSSWFQQWFSPPPLRFPSFRSTLSSLLAQMRQGYCLIDGRSSHASSNGEHTSTGLKWFKVGLGGKRVAGRETRSLVVPGIDFVDRIGRDGHFVLGAIACNTHHGCCLYRSLSFLVSRLSITTTARKGSARSPRRSRRRMRRSSNVPRCALNGYDHYVKPQAQRCQPARVRLFDPPWRLFQQIFRFCPALV